MKTLVLDMTDHLPDDQVFSYYHGEEMLHFNVTMLARIHKRVPKLFDRITMDIDEAIYDLCMKHRGIEEPKVEALLPKHLREPGYGVMLDGFGSFTVVDGHHRLVRRYRGGVRQMDFYVCNRQVWDHCLVHYPKELEALLAEAMPERQIDPPPIASHVTIHEGEK